MGGSFSEVGTCVDLNTCIEFHSRSWALRKQTGYQIGNLQFNQIFCGLLHVDDSAVGSGIWCSDCIFKFLQMIFPQDVGVELEETGDAFQFLSSVLVFTEGRDFL